MSSSRWMSLMQHVTVVGTAVILATCFARAQSIIFPTESSSNSYSRADSSSHSSQFVKSGGSDGIAVLPSAPAPGGSGANQYRGLSGYDLSDHISVEAGAGFNAPIGNDIPYITWGGNFRLGGGLHLSKRLIVLAEYQFMDNKLPGALIAEAGTQGGHTHIWSLTLDPMIDLFPRRANSVYITGGGGFYRKVTSFTEPGEYENVVVGHFSSNQGGVGLGLGLTHRLRWENGEQIFAEARYLFLNTPSITQSNGLETTELLPVTIGVRW
jgi:hypothetical protein